MASARTTHRHSSVSIININKWERAADWSFFKSAFQSESQGDLNPLRVSYSACFSINLDAGKCVWQLKHPVGMMQSTVWP